MSVNRRACKPARVLPLIISLTLTTSAQAQRQVNDSTVGYVGNAIPGNQVRLRFDAAFGADFPDRAEFFYAAWAGARRGAPGPRLAETNVDYRDVRALVEVSPFANFSVFGELPVRGISAERNSDSTGLADVNAGFKWALYEDCCTIATLQLRAFFPTGDARRGLGTDHASLEPAVLINHRFSDRLTLEAELREWFPLDGTRGVAGEVVRYGMGAGYLVHQSCRCSIRPIAEIVGWTVLDGGKSSKTRRVIDAAGDSIVNLKVGVRIGFGWPEDFNGERSSLYLGFGQALTSEVWYENIARVEYRLAF